MVGVAICIVLAYFVVVGAAIAGDLSDPGVWVVLGVFALLAAASIQGRRRDDRP